MWALNCCDCLQFSSSFHPCLLCGHAQGERTLVPSCNLVASSKCLSKCLVLLVPPSSESLKRHVLHIGVVTTQGKVVDLDEDGVSCRVWKKKKPCLLEIPIQAPATTDWDVLLMEHMEHERNVKFDKRTNNCLDFVCRFLNRSLFTSSPLSRHQVSGLLLAPWLGRYQWQIKMRDASSTSGVVWLFRPAVLRIRHAKSQAALLCDLCCEAPNYTVRSCVTCRAQSCSICVFLHVCIPVSKGFESSGVDTWTQQMAHPSC